MRRTKTRDLVVAGMLSAIAFVLMFMDFPLPMLIPAFIKMDFSDLPALLGAFSLGPVYGIIISLMKNLLHILIRGTSTAAVGELSNFILGAIFAYVAGIIYKRMRTRKGALIGAVAGTLAMAVISVPSNYYITYPAYSKFYGLPMETILSMYQAILPWVDNIFECLVVFNLPFNFMKGILDVILCFMIYKPLSPLLHGKRH
ncbi:MAG: ECF transporter S component [Faecalibacterium sp.]|nr:ECF transporter S component [Faecalibacterium sp.]